MLLHNVRRLKRVGLCVYYELTDKFIVAAGGAKTWDFFSRAENLPKITPPWLSFLVHTPAPIEIRGDSFLDYTIRWAKFPVRWRTRIIDWSPPRQFIDFQVRGPYSLWHHQHTFVQVEQGTLCRDRVIYRLPFGVLGRLAHATVVRRQLVEIFRFRRKVIAEHLGWVQAVHEDIQIARL